MSQLFKVFIEKEALEDIILLDDKYPNLNAIFGSGNCEFFININEDDLEAILTDGESDLRKFSDSHDLSFTRYQSSPEDFAQLYHDEKLDIRDGRVIYIVDEDTSKASSLQNKYGVFVLSCKDIRDNLFEFGYTLNCDKGDNINGEGTTGWENLLNQVDLPPVNSIVITDDHLLDNMDHGVNVGESNMIDFLNAVIPENIVSPIHVTILSSANKNKSSKIAKRIIEAVSKLKGNIYIDVDYCNTLHKRRIISNYFVIEADWGFKLFETRDERKSHYYHDNEIKIESIFNDLKFRGDICLNISYSDLDKIQKIRENLKRQSDSVNDPTKKIIKSSDVMPDNRLFSDL